MEENAKGCLHLLEIRWQETWGKIDETHFILNSYYAPVILWLNTPISIRVVVVMPMVYIMFQGSYSYVLLCIDSLTAYKNLQR